MIGTYRGWWWAYLGGLIAGVMLEARDDWWFLVPALLTAVYAVERQVDP